MVPSPKSQSYEVIEATGDERFALKLTNCPLTGSVGDIEKSAVRLPEPTAATLTGTVTLPCWPASSVTVKVSVNVPAAVNVCAIDAIDAVITLPSPKFQAYVVIVWPPAAVEPDALKKTGWSALGVNGENVNVAIVALPPPLEETTGTALATVVA